MDIVEIRKTIISALLEKPELGKNYIDYHTEDGTACVAILLDNNDSVVITLSNN